MTDDAQSMCVNLPSRSGGGFWRSGLTLPELMIVLVVMIIIALVVAPGGSDNATTRLRAAADLLLADLEYAQVQSIGHGADLCVVVFDQAEHAYHLARTSDPTQPLIDDTTGLPYKTKFGEGRARRLTDVTIDDLDVNDDDALLFTAMGALNQAEDATITLACGGRTLTIRVDATTGEVTVD